MGRDSAARVQPSPWAPLVKLKSWAYKCCCVIEVLGVFAPLPLVLPRLSEFRATLTAAWEVGFSGFSWAPLGFFAPWALVLTRLSKFLAASAAWEIGHQGVCMSQEHLSEFRAAIAAAWKLGCAVSACLRNWPLEMFEGLVAVESVRPRPERARCLRGAWDGRANAVVGRRAWASSHPCLLCVLAYPSSERRLRPRGRWDKAGTLGRPWVSSHPGSYL
jgi:hypothetical protein